MVYRDIPPTDLPHAMDFGFYTDFQNVAYGAPTTTWEPSLVAGVTMNEDVRKMSEFLSPRVPCQASPGGAYAYHYYPARNVVRSPSETPPLRGQGGDFPLIGTKGEVKTGTLKNYGVAVAVEKSLAEASPAYEMRAVRAAYSVLESAIIEEQIAALTAIANDRTSRYSSGCADLSDSIVSPLYAVYTSAAEQGHYPNRLAMTVRAWLALLYGLKVAGGESPYSLPYGSVEEYARQFCLEGRLLTPLWYNGGDSYLGIGDLAAKSYTYVFSASNFGDSLGTTNIATFTNGDINVSSFDHPQGELRIYTVSIWFDVAVVNPYGVYRIGDNI